MTWHPEILSRRQQRVLSLLGQPLTRRGFYLAGGTALALHLGHRRSVDLDWFTAEPVEDPLRLAQGLREEGLPFVTGQVAAGTLYGTMLGVRLSLLEYRYPLLSAVRPWRQGKCRLASRADLAAMKLAAVAQRGSKKDFIDIYGLGSRSCSLRQMLHWYRAKYALQDMAHVLYSLTYFDDADRERTPRLVWDVGWPVMKETIRHWVREVSR
jgi:hypothetical protein